MSKPMSKSDLISKLAEENADKLSRKDVKSVLETLASVGYKELKKTGVFLLPGFAKFVVIKKPATKERKGINPFTKEPTVFKAKPAPQGAEGPPGQGRQRRGLSGLRPRKKALQTRAYCGSSYIFRRAWTGSRVVTRRSAARRTSSPNRSRRGLSGAVDAGRKPDQVAPRPYVLVFRDVRAGGGAAGTGVRLPVQLVLRGRRSASSPRRARVAVASVARRGSPLSPAHRRAGPWRRSSAACATRFVPASCWASNTSSSIRS
jgi:nucleoid DNA-binding protein